jgi:23S rRNA pseudouridine1911/1915/1917 synthase
MTLDPLRVDESAAGMRLDLFLARQFMDGTAPRLGLSRAAIQKLIAEGQITLNNAVTKASTRVKSDDRIDIYFLPPRETGLRAEALPLDILYEDADCVVVNKAPGIVVHPAAGRSSGTLVNALLHHCADLAGVGGERRPGIVHRLDKDTSGVMIVAKNMRAFHQLVAQFKNRTVEKEYIALVWGGMRTDRGTIDRAIGRHRSDRKRMSSLHMGGRAREAITEWWVEERFAFDHHSAPLRAVTLLRLRPRTGRTHQLRVHLADMGNPLIGDKVYGRKRNGNAAKLVGDQIIDSFPRQALHAEKLTLVIGQNLRRMQFVAPLPSDLEKLLLCLREREIDDRGARIVINARKGVDKRTALK